MNRTKQREQAFILTFESLFDFEEADKILEVFEENYETAGDYAKSLYQGICNNSDELDKIISTYSNGWKINRISKVNIAILRIAVYEIKYVDSVPNSVAANEAVELAKKYSEKEDSSFVNGIIGAYLRGKSDVSRV